MQTNKRNSSMILLAATSVVVAACSAPTPTAAPKPAATTAPAAPAPAATTAPAAAAPTAAPKPTDAPKPAAAPVTIRYTLWDSGQQPAYEACAAEFSKKNPNIKVKIEQLGWDDYWNGITTGFVSGTAPDVFTNHLAKYPEFVQKNLILDIEPFVKRDNVPTNIYLGKLPDLWMREGKRFGLPKDWDTISVVYNEDMLKKANIDPKTLGELTWNAKDGGSFGQLVAKLTLDKNGKNGLDPAFDKKSVVQYGFVPPSAGGFAGQTEWSSFAASNGFKLTDGVWGSKYFYDDPKLAETIQWYADLNLVKGWTPPLADIKSLGGGTIFKTGKAALHTVGSWQIGEMTKDVKFKSGFAPVPKGPEGRKSMFNGLADSITANSKNKEEAWQWVKYAASAECEKIVGTFGVVFPATQEGVNEALKIYKGRGLEVTSFTDIASDPAGTFLFPITDNGAEIAKIMDATMDSIMLGQVKAADALAAANTKVNALFKK